MDTSRKAPRISVIVPVYNVGAFLDQCLSSVRAQTMNDMEVICLNDGSTDDSLAIMKHHAARDGRLRVVDKENEGYGATCNRGIDLARGEYVAIVEPDDYLLPTMYEDLLAFVDSFSGKIDVAKEAWFDVIDWDDPSAERIVSGYLYKRLSTSRTVHTVDELPELLEGHPAIWSALYRREFLSQRGIRFRAYPGAGWADNPFLVDTLCQAERIVYLDAMHYCYRNELSGGKGRPVDEERLAMPLARWEDMTQGIAACGVDDPLVWQAHYQRGFNYIDDIIAQGGWESPRIKAGIRDVLLTMKEDLVLGHPKLSPAKKRFYLEQIGRTDIPKLSSWPYMRHLAREFAVRLRAQGLAGACRALGGFSRQKASGRDAEKVK